MNRPVEMNHAVAHRSGPSPILQPAGKLHSPVEQVNAEFDGVVLKTFVEAMLPKNATSVYGRGTAGEIWKSYLAERIANELGRSGQINILSGR